LSAEQLNALLDDERHPDSGLPLYLVVALEELSLFGDFERLTARIRDLPRSVSELFQQVLARLEADHGREMAGAICRWLAASRSGLLESEVLELLRGRTPDLPTVRWTRLYRALEFYLRPFDEETNDGLLDFYHEQLRFAVFDRYFGMPSTEAARTTAYRTTHEDLAIYFRSLCCLDDGDEGVPRWHPDHVPDGAIPPVRWPDAALEAVREGNARARGLAELPFHLTESDSDERRAELYRVLTDLGFLEAKCTYVGKVQTGPREDRRTVYNGVYELQEDYRRALEVLASIQT
jgi:hypothetical protein